jgi:hypothetical protein
MLAKPRAPLVVYHRSNMGGAPGSPDSEDVLLDEGAVSLSSAHWNVGERRPGEELTDFGAIDLKKGGTAIPYHEEDLYVRAEFEAALKAEGVSSRMDAKLYQTPEGYPK